MNKLTVYDTTIHKKIKVNSYQRERNHFIGRKKNSYMWTKGWKRRFQAKNDKKKKSSLMFNEEGIEKENKWNDG